MSLYELQPTTEESYLVGLECFVVKPACISSRWKQKHGKIGLPPFRQPCLDFLTIRGIAENPMPSP